MTRDAGPRGLLFVRHGESTDNARHLRSGGDVDPDLTETGRQQAGIAARQLGRILEGYRGRVQLITAPLRRTRETTVIIARSLNLDPDRAWIWAGFRERRLGHWNGLPADDASRRLILAGATPPGGEAEADFRARVSEAAARAADLARDDLVPLVISSRGVARILGVLDMPNGAVLTWPACYRIGAPPEGT